MNVWKKLFRSVRPTKRPDLLPVIAIQPNDRDLITHEDLDWWNSLSFQDFEALKREDDALKLAAFTSFKEQGLDTVEAAKCVRLRFLHFYVNDSDWAEPQFHLPDQDTPLPYPLKERINRAMIAGKISPNDFAQASSANAIIRQKIRADKWFGKKPPSHFELLVDELVDLGRLTYRWEGGPSYYYLPGGEAKKHPRVVEIGMELYQMGGRTITKMSEAAERVSARLGLEAVDQLSRHWHNIGLDECKQHKGECWMA